MRREGRQRGWVRVYDRELVDPEGKRRAAHVVGVDGAVVVANGGFVRASRKPTNHSKPGGRRALEALCRKALAQEEEEEAPPPQPAARYGYSSGWWASTPPFSYGAVAQKQAQVQPPAAARSGAGKASSKGGRKFKHGKISKTYYLDEDEIDYLYNYDS